MAYKRKIKDVWVMYVDYGYGAGFEYELEEESREEMHQREMEYLLNCPRYETMVKKMRVKI